MNIPLKYGEIGLVVAIGSIAYSVYLSLKLKKIATSVDLTVEELATKTHIDIADSMINSAVQKAVDREIQDIARTTNRRLTEEIRTQVKASINMSYSELKGSVANEIATQVKNIDMRDIEKEAVNRAKDAIAEKFDSKLDGLLEDFNSNLSNVSKIYTSIAKTMSEKI